MATRPPHQASAWRLEALEPRLLLNADAAAFGLDPAPPAEEQVLPPEPLLHEALIERAAEDEGSPAPAGVDHANLPLRFESNEGQLDTEVDFVARGSGYAVFLSEGDAVINVGNADGGHVVRLDLIGANTQVPASRGAALTGTSSYLIGADANEWVTGVAGHADVRYHGVYEGIDVRYYGNQRQLEYDFIVEPGANADAIRLNFDGARSVNIADNGDLVLELDDTRSLRFMAPVSFQDGPQGRQAVDSAYVVHDDGTVGFTLGDYDRSRTLTIDPILDYGSYLGGIGEDVVNAVAVDADGNVYLAGDTTSTDFPVTTGAYGPTGGSYDAFVSKLASDGSSLIYSAYIGGTASDFANGIAVDAAGNAYVVGQTFSSDFATTAGAFDQTFGSGNDAFALKLNAAGTALEYSTFIGTATSNDKALAVAVDGAGRAHVAGQLSGNGGWSTSADAVQGAVAGGQDGFISILSADGSAQEYGTYFGGGTAGAGNANDQINALALDASGRVYVTGFTHASDLTTTGDAHQAAFDGNREAFVAVIDPTISGAAGLVYSSYLGGSGKDEGFGIEVDGAGLVHVVGATESSTDFDLTAGAYQGTFGGGPGDAFYATFDLTAPATLAYSTYLGGSGNESAFAVGLGPTGEVYIAGETQSASGFPTTPDAHDLTKGGTKDGFLVQLDPAGAGAADLQYGTFFGGDTGAEQIRAMAVDGNGHVVVAGQTTSSDFDATTGAHDVALAGVSDGFVARIYAADLVVDTQNDLIDGNVTSVSALLGNKGADGFVSLREAIIATNNTSGADLILLQAGTYNLTLTGAGENAAATGDLDIIDDLTILGSGTGITVIDGGGDGDGGITTDRVFEVAGATVSMSDLTIQGGDILNHGGGLLLDISSDVTLSNVVMTGNLGSIGGAIRNDRGILTLADVTLDGNIATSDGGGLYNTGTTTLGGVTVSNNTGQSNAGGIWSSGASGSLVATNVTISGNTTPGNGGGLYNAKLMTLRNVTVTDNTAGQGAGIHETGGGATTNLSNTIVAANTGAADLSGSYTSLGNNLIGDKGTSSGFTDGVNGDQAGDAGTPLDPMLSVLAANGGPTQTHQLLAGSTAIDAGTGVGAPVEDQRGQARSDGLWDIGAFEVFDPTPDVNTVTVTNATDDLNGNVSSISALIGNDGGDGISLREAIEAANNTPNLAGGPDRIEFAIGSGTARIAWQSLLPQVLKPVVIDATTQPGFAGDPLIELDGTNGGFLSARLIFAPGSDGSTLTGVAIIDNMDAIRIQSDGNTIQGNWIGLDRFGNPSQNYGDGIEISGSNNVIGGVNPGQGNVIANAVLGGNGVNVISGTGNVLRGNSIYGNAALGIDLGDDGVTPNDVGLLDADPGANGLQNHPVMTRADNSGGSILLEGTLDSAALTGHDLDFFWSTTGDGSGYGEATSYIGSVNVTTDGAGLASFSQSFAVAVPSGAAVTATATGPDGTSEFALNLTANTPPVITTPGVPPVYVENTTPVVVDGGITLSDPDSADFDGGVLTVDFAAAGTGDDRLAIRDQGPGVSNVSLSGSAVTYDFGAGAVAIGTFAGGQGAGDPLIVTFNAAATPGAVQAVMRNVTFGNVSDAPSTTARDVSFQLSDGDGGTSTPALQSVNVSAVNDGPRNQVPLSGMQVIDGAASQAITTASGDIDGDGDIDVVGGTFLDDSVVWYENDGAGGFVGQTIITSTADGVRGVAAGDIDGDGDLDVAVTSSLDNTVAWYENDGAGAFTEHVITTTAAGASSVVITDLDNDGNMDIIAGSTDDDSITWWANNGSEVFSATTVTTTANFVRSIAVADMDGDSDLDVLSASYVDDTVAWYENQGAGAFAKHVVSNTFDGAVAIVAVDIDGDLDQDIVAAADLGDKVSLFENQGAGVFVEQVLVTADGARSVTAADLDNDGDMDLVAGSQVDDTIQVLRNNTGTFAAETVTTTSAYPIALDTADLDGDGDSDLLVAEFGANQFQWYANNGARVGEVRTDEDVPVVFSTAGGNAITVFDPDSGASDIRVTLTATNGRMTLASVAGLSLGPGDGTDDVLVTFTGPLADVQAALDGLTFTPTEHFFGTATIQVDTDDLGNTGSGGAKSDSDLVTIVVDPVPDAPTGVPVVTGTAAEDQVLTADTSGISDGDGLGAYTYQWLRDNVAVGGATGSTYTLGDADVGTRISVEVSYTDGGGDPEGPLTSAQTAPVANVNDPPTGSVTITGTPTEDQVLTAGNTLGDADGLGPIGYQWQRGGVDIGGATASTYTLGDDDVGEVITVVASFTDGHGTAESVTSAGTAPIANVNDAPTASNSTVTTNEDTTHTFAATDFNFSDPDPGDTLQKVRITSLPSTGNLRLAGIDVTLNQVIDVADIDAGNLTFTPLPDQNGTAYDAFGFKVSDGTSLGAVGTVLSSFAAPVVNSMSGLAFDGTDLWLNGQSTNTVYRLATDGTVLSSFAAPGTNPTGLTFDGTHLWLVDRDLDTIFELTTTGTVVSSFATPGVDSRGLTWDGTNLWLVEGTGSLVYELTTTGSVVSSFAWPDDYPRGITWDGTNLWLADQNDRLIHEMTTTGTLLSSVASPGTSPAGITYDGTQIWHADADTDTIYEIAGPNSTVFSAAEYTMSIDVTPVNDAPAGVPTITGTVAEDQVLTANTGGISDVDGLGAFNYQWQRGGADIGGATGSTYTLGDADVGTQISVEVTYTDGDGTAEGPLTSAQTAAVTNVNDAPAGSPVITGTVTEDQVLTADTSGISDDDGLGAFTYQWLRDNVAVGGATAATYTLGDADVGKKISVEVSYTDVHGTAEGPLTSAQTANVANVNDTPAGLPTITGTVTEDQMLTADTSGISDDDGLGAFSYQWLRDGGVIGGATSSTYTLGDADVGKKISVEVSYTDVHGTPEMVTSAQTANVANINDTPAGLPTITGTVTEDQVLTADTSGISDDDGLGAFSYQWLRDGGVIGGATSSTYTLGDADVGKKISVEVSYTDVHGTAEGPLTSAQTANVANVNDTPAGLPTITGTVTEDQMLTADTSGISDDDGLGAFSYQWLRDGGVIGGATSSTYTLGDADVGKKISVEVSYTDVHGTPEMVTSAQTANVANVNDTPAGVPAITGTVTEDQVLTADTSGISDDDGLSAFSYQWLRDGGVIAGATAGTYTLADADVGKKISVEVSWTDTHGTPEMVTSAQTANVANINDTPAGLPTITGTVTEDQMLTADTSGISDDDGLGAFSYQWLRDGGVIGGATASTYTLGDADVGKKISVEVSYTDVHGTAEGPLTSAQTANVANVNDAPAGLPTITGTVTEDQMLTADTSGISDDDGLGAFSYQWLRDGGVIGGATAATYTLGDADVGKKISVEVSYTDVHGTPEGPLTSAQTTNVANVNDTPAGLPTITGTVTEDQMLTADTSGISDDDGLGAFSYQWLRDGGVIGGANASTYTLGDTDVGKKISVEVSWTDTHGTPEMVTSAQTANVANVNDTPAGLPTITGTVTEDQMLTADTSGISDDDGLGAFSYQWLRDGGVIGGATASTYTLGDADVGKKISVEVSYTDTHGTPEGPLISAQTANVANVNDTPAGLPTITGTVTEDQMLTADTSGISDDDGLGAFSYQWLRDGGVIGGATASTYTLGDADVGKKISVEVSWTDTHGTPEMVTSAQTANVANVNDTPAGLPTITGTITEDQMLNADTSGISDDDGLGAFSYQWLRDGGVIAGATASTYTLGDADVGKKISVEVSWTDTHGTPEMVTSAQTANVANINDNPAGLPTITGTVTEDQMLTADTSGISDDDGLGAFSYQWLRDGGVITGATASTYTLGDADVGKKISVEVFYTDVHGTPEGPLASAQTANVTKVNDTPEGLPTITGSVTEDQMLTADTSGISDDDGLGAFAYQWLRDGGVIAGANATTYTLGDADVGKKISVEVSWTDTHGTPEMVTSAQTANVANVNDTPAGLPTITGTVTEDQMLTADTSGISDDDGLGAFAYQWLHDGGVIAGANAATYTLGDADVGKNISVEISYTDAHGTPEGPLTSAQTANVANVNDTPAGLPAITGTVTEDQMLTADTSGISDDDGLGAFSYQWLRGGDVITGATASTYTLSDPDVGKKISVEVSYIDVHGTSEGPLTSAQTANVANLNDDPIITSPATTSIVENDTSVLTVTSFDANGDAVSYNISGGADQARFTIDATSGFLQFVTPPDFDAPADIDSDNIYLVQVSSSDGLGGSATQNLTVTVTDQLKAGAPTDIESETGLDVEEPLGLTVINPTPEIAEAVADLLVDADPAASDLLSLAEALENLSRHSAADADDSVSDDALGGSPFAATEAGSALGNNEFDRDSGDTKTAESRNSVLPTWLLQLEQALRGLIPTMQDEPMLTDADGINEKLRPLQSVEQQAALDRLVTDLKDEAESASKVEIGMVQGVGVSLTAGILHWLLRAGALAGSFVSTMPMWMRMDPLPVLGRTRSEHPAVHDASPERSVTHSTDDDFETMLDRTESGQDKG